MLPPIEFPEALPVSARRADITAALRAHQAIVVCGETGSGKTTQLPKIALAMGRGRGNGGGLIGHIVQYAKEVHAPKFLLKF